MKHYLYLFYSGVEIIYVGKTTRLNQRMREHIKNDKYYDEVTKIMYVEINDRYESDLAEKLYIATYLPKYNKNSKPKEKINIQFVDNYVFEEWIDEDVKSMEQETKSLCQKDEKTLDFNRSVNLAYNNQKVLVKIPIESLSYIWRLDNNTIRMFEYTLAFCEDFNRVNYFNVRDIAKFYEIDSHIGWYLKVQATPDNFLITNKDKKIYIYKYVKYDNAMVEYQFSEEFIKLLSTESILYDLKMSRYIKSYRTKILYFIIRANLKNGSCNLYFDKLQISLNTNFKYVVEYKKFIINNIDTINKAFGIKLGVENIFKGKNIIGITVFDLYSNADKIK